MKLEEILATLHEEEFLESSEIPESARPPAWYLRVLAALGAWLSTLFLVFFWALMASQSFALGLFFGLVQSLAAAWLASRRRAEMLNQAALSLWLTGICLLVVTCVEQFNLHALGAGMLLLFLAAGYPESQGRFLAALAGGITLVVGLQEVPMDIVVGPLALLAGLHYLNQTQLWWRGWGRRTASFAGVAVLTMLFALCTSFGDWTRMPAGAASTGLLTLACLWLSSRVLQRLRAPLQPSLVVWLGLLAIGALTLSTPGVLGGIAVLLLARESRSGWLAVVGWLYLLIFTSAYYYELNVSLNFKALSLLLLGGLLLAIRRFLVAKP
ncbi:MAG: DUF4401 domain-containing protein [Candidatus Eremiobacteraeota bacterium]|nr:DUF4401 domain-containing protein [Candidatus Eremiobacteraeota bacterium]MCW5866139.1 DUF4401 domain-containing protein [Candidatus Eremiobacteraeota bacterium]